MTDQVQTDSEVPTEEVPTEEVSTERFSQFQEFWPYYLSEHGLPACRWVHFIGTSGFVAYLIYLITLNPVRLGGAFLLSIILGTVFFSMEAKRSTAPVLLCMIGMIGWADPHALYGVLFAYFFAWVGHFLIEHNRPATFTYPLWSLVGDFRMWLDMLRGQRWGEADPNKA